MMHGLLGRAFSGFQRMDALRPRPALLRYGSAMAALVLATAVRILLDPVLGDWLPYLTYFIATVFVAWYAGLGPSAIMAVAGPILADFCFVEPRGAWHHTPQELYAMGRYVLAGGAIAVFGEALDINRRRHAASEQKYRRLLDYLQEGILSVDRDGRILFANPYISEILGCTAEKMLGRNVSEFLGDSAIEVCRRALQPGDAGREERSELSIRRCDGSCVHISVAAAPTLAAETLAVEVVLAVVDITQRRQAEEAARLEEKRLRSVLKVTQRQAQSLRDLLDCALDEAVTLSDSTFGYIYFFDVDSEGFKFHAWSREGLGLYAIPAPAAATELGDVGLTGEVVRQRRPIIINDFATSSPHANGLPEAARPARCLSLPLFNEDRVVAVVGVANKPTDYTDTDLRQLTLLMESIWEIAERKRAEEDLARELAVNRAMSELSSTLIATASSVQDVTDITLRYAKLLTGSAHGFVSVIDPANGDQICKTLTAMIGTECLLQGEEQRITFPLGPDGTYAHLWGHSLNTRRPFFTNTPASHEAAGGLPAGHIPLKNFLSVPALIGDRLVGQVALANSERGYTNHDLEVVKRLTSLYAVALGRKETEDALLQANTYNRTLIEACVDPLVMIDTHGKIADVNKAAEEISGYTREEIVGTDCALYFSEPEKTLEGYGRAFREGSVRNLALEMIRRDGTIRSLLCNGATYCDAAGQVAGILAVARDVTERKRAEEAVRKLAGQLLTAQEEERRRLAREMHDDLTQRLAVLAIDAGRLEHELEAEGTASERLREMKEQLIGLSRDVHGLSRQLHPSILDDLGLADALRSECARFSQREKIAVQCEVDQVPQGIPKATALCLYRIAQEALRNVAKHSHAKQARLSLATANDGLLLSVEDAGVGFDRKQQRGQGGVGLASMEERARLIGGDFSVHSEPGKGTLVEVWAPVSEDQS